MATINVDMTHGYLQCGWHGWETEFSLTFYCVDTEFIISFSQLLLTSTSYLTHYTCQHEEINLDSILWTQRQALFPGEGNGNPLQYSCLENPVDRGAWWAAVHGVTQSWTRLRRLRKHACTGEGNGNPLQCSCLENPRDGGASWAAVYGVAQSRTRLKRLSSSSSSVYVNPKLLIYPFPSLSPKFVFYVCWSISVLYISSFAFLKFLLLGLLSLLSLHPCWVS